MKRVARSLAAIYALAIILASLAPHCDWMFPSALAAVASATTTDHDHHGDGHSQQKSERDCPPMEMAKSVAPPMADVAFPAPLLVILPTEVSLAATLPRVASLEGAEPRGPPPSTGGFAAVFSRNHRLLI